MLPFRGNVDLEGWQQINDPAISIDHFNRNGVWKKTIAHGKRCVFSLITGKIEVSTFKI